MNIFKYIFISKEEAPLKTVYVIEKVCLFGNGTTHFYRSCDVS